MRHLPTAAIALLLVSAACGDDGTGPTTGELITLTSAQAAALVAQVEEFGAADPNLASLSDTVEVVIKAGAQARRIDVTTDLGSGPFWAVSLHMPSTMSTPAASTFHVIAFNEPSSPTQFLIFGGWAQGAGSTPPTAVTGSLSGPTATTSVTAHLFSVSGGQLSMWHATAGSSGLNSNGTQESCPGFAGPGTCTRATMDATFSITASVPDQNSAATGQRTATGSVADIPGIRISP